MRILAFNGSPRKTWNTATLLGKALEGAASQGAETELIHLYELNFKGCRSCFACKAPGEESYCKCAAKDDLTPILEKVRRADALILGSPIYFGAVTGVMKMFLERLMFPYHTYSDRPLFPKRIKTAFIYTMNTPEENVKDFFGQHMASNGWLLEKIFGESETLLSTDTYHLQDYLELKVAGNTFDATEKAKQRRKLLPLDCHKAFEMGARFAGKSQ